MAINTDYIEKENDQKLDELEKNLEKTVTIAVVGKVSAGKSSLLNALFNKSKSEQLATVGAISGAVVGARVFGGTESAGTRDERTLAFGRFIG